MMEDFHDSARRAGEALAAATSVEAEARATGGGPSRRVRLLQSQRPEGAAPLGSATPQVATGGGRPVGLGDSTPTGGGLSRRALGLP
jgi:hypothetical protein